MTSRDGTSEDQCLPITDFSCLKSTESHPPLLCSCMHQYHTLTVQLGDSGKSDVVCGYQQELQQACVASKATLEAHVAFP